MPSYSYMELLTTAQAAGTALANTTTPGTLLPAQALHTIAPDDWYIGKSIMIKAAGSISNVVTAAPTITLNVLFGATTVFTTGAVICSTTAHTNVPWMLEIMLTCRSLGSGTSATVMGQGQIISRAFVDVSGADVTTTGHPTLMAPETAPAVGTGFSSNASQQVDLQGAWSAASASNSLTLHQYWLFQLN